MDDMDSTRLATSAGLLTALVALSATGLSWPDVAGVVGGMAVVNAAFAALVLGAFVALEQDALDRRVAAAVAALGSVGLVAYAVYAGTAIPAADASYLDGMNVAGSAGALGLLVSFVGSRDLSSVTLTTQVREATVGLAIGIVGLASIYVVAFVLVIALSLGGSQPGPMFLNALSTLALGIGMGLTALFVLSTTGKGLDYIDLKMPSLRDVGYMVVGVVAIYGTLVGISILFSTLGIETGTHSIVEEAKGNPQILLVMIPASYVFIGPGEELLFRNVIQKRLYDSYSDVGAILVASAIFGVVHLPAYGWSATSVVTVAFLALVLGTVYRLTDNIVVPAFVHGTFNAVQFLILYVAITQNVPV